MARSPDAGGITATPGCPTIRMVGLRSPLTLRCRHGTGSIAAMRVVRPVSSFRMFLPWPHSGQGSELFLGPLGMGRQRSAIHGASPSRRLIGQHATGAASLRAAVTRQQVEAVIAVEPLQRRGCQPSTDRHTALACGFDRLQNVMP